MHNWDAGSPRWRWQSIHPLRISWRRLENRAVRFRRGRTCQKGSTALAGSRLPSFVLPCDASPMEDKTTTAGGLGGSGDKGDRLKGMPVRSTSSVWLRPDAPIDFRRWSAEEAFKLVCLLDRSEIPLRRAKKGKMTIPVCRPQN